jgi:hypothetical protein
VYYQFAYNRDGLLSKTTEAQTNEVRCKFVVPKPVRAHPAFYRWVQAPLDLTFGMAPGPNTPEGWEVRLQLPLGVTIPVADAGTFAVEVKADDDSLSVPIMVRLSSPPAP